MNWINGKLSPFEAKLDCEANCNSAKISASQIFNPELGTITEVTIRANTAYDVNVALAALKAEYGSPVGIKRASAHCLSCLWTKPLAPWPSALNPDFEDSRVEEICKARGLTAEERTYVSTVLLTFQQFPNTIRLVGYIFCQVKELPADQRRKIINAALEIRKAPLQNRA